ncbi:MAG: SDR family oxidoreductase, partial [Bacteroidota bacterium]
VVVLKRLSKAIEDGDHIYAVLKGAAINNDGGTKADYTAPSVQGQKAVIQQAQQLAGIAAKDISYVEAHGTATKLGDPIEIKALTEAFDVEAGKHCAIGSVKTNFGHLELAAGVAGFVKTVLMLKHKTLVPSLHFTKANPRLNLDKSPFYVNTKTKKWKNKQGPLLAGVSSFGIGGTNAHVILQEAPRVPTSVAADNGKNYLIPLSALTEKALREQKNNLLNHIRQQPAINLEALSYSLQTGRKALPLKEVLLSRSTKQLMEQLEGNGDGQTGILKFKSDKGSRQVVFMFPGGGTQYVNMSRELYEKVPYFKDQFDECLGFLEDSLSQEIREVLFPSTNTTDFKKQTERLRQIEFFHPVIFIVEYTLAKLMMHWGVQPHALIGHSLGEYAAACIAGIFSLEDALNIVVRRGKLMQSMPHGLMMTVNIPEEQLLELLPEDVSLAVVNSSTFCVVSGEKAAVEHFAEVLTSKNIECKILRISHASHSYMMEPIIQELEDSIRQVQLNKARIPITATSKGYWLSDEEATNPVYWAEQVRNTVRFHKSLESIFDQHSDKKLFLEVGPGKTLSTFVRAHEQKQTGDQVLQLMRHPKDDTSDWEVLLENIARLYLLDQSINWNHFWDQQKINKLPLPTYPFAKTQYKGIKGFSKNKSLFSANGQTEKTAVKKPVANWFYRPAWKEQRLTASPNPSGKTLLFLATEPADPTQILRPFGQAACLVINGTKNQKRAEQVYEVNLHQAENLQWLFQQLKTAQWSPEQIYYCLLLGKTETSASPSYDAYFYPLAHIANQFNQAFPKQKLGIKILVNQLTNVFGQKDIVPEKALVTGLARTIPQEFPNCATKIIHLSQTDLGTVLTSKVGKQLMAEPVSEARNYPDVSYFNQRRWVLDYETLDAQAQKDTRSQIKKHGTYLLTGGLGKVGFILSKYLLQNYEAQLILTGRSEIDINANDQKSMELLDRLTQLKALPGKVQYYAADLLEEEKMRGIVQKAEQGLGPINGLIHAAGILSEQTFELIPALNQNRQDLAQQIQTKVQGLQVLHRIFQEHTLDFCTVTSSISTLIGGRGFATYSAVNAYLDTCVQQLANSSELPWLSVNWDIWKTGLGEIDLAILDEEGGPAFDFAINYTGEYPQIITSVCDLHQRLETAWQVPEEVAVEQAQSEEGLERPELMTPYVAPSSDLEKQLVAIWSAAIGYKDIGVNDDFFELGANSLKVVAVKAKINKIFQVDIPIKVLFNQSNVAQLAQYIEQAERVDRITISPVAKRDYYEVSASQKRFYLLQQLDPKETVYNMPQMIPLKQKVKVEQMQQIFTQIATAHEALRTSFHLVDGQLMQKIEERPDIQMQVQQITKEQVAATRKSLIRPFDLSNAPLFRVELIETTDSQEQYLFLDAHHIIFDGISLRKLIREIYSAYEGETLLAPQLSYKDFAAWQNSAAQQERLQEQANYWMEQFKTPPSVLEWPTDKVRPTEYTYRGAYRTFELDHQLTQALKAWSREQEATLFITLLSFYYLLLYRLTGQRDLTLGVPVAGREGQEELKSVIGAFLNTLALRLQVNEEMSFQDFYQQVKQRVVEAFDHQSYPFDRIIEQLHVGRDASRNPMFDVFFVMQNHAVDLDRNYLFDESELYVEANEKAKFDLTLAALELDNRIEMTLSYYADIFEEDSALRLTDMYQQIAKEAIANPNSSIAELAILSEKEEKKILAFSHYPNHFTPPSETLLSVFDQQVKAYPQQEALSYLDRQYSYQELDQITNALAHYLLEQHPIALEDFIALEMPRTDWAIIGILAIMKTGAAYVPIDPNYPEDRKSFLRADSQCKVILNEESITAFKAQQKNYPTTAVNRNIQPSNLAYMIYTSGTTGQPKGVMIQHGSIVNTNKVKIKNFKISPSSKVLQLFSLSFDASVADIFQALLA